MVFCKNCGKELLDNAKYCFECGTQINVSTVFCEDKRAFMYDGEIHKCPSCGEIMGAYESVCEKCGYERRGVKATASVREFLDELQIIEHLRPIEERKNKGQEDEQDRKEISNTDRKKINLIQNFPIPNTKEDMYEFLVLASSNVDVRTYGLGGGSFAQKEISNAWYNKFEQAYKKAQLVFGKREDFADIILLYQQKRDEIANEKKKKCKAIFSIILGSLAVFFILLVLIIILSTAAAKSNRQKVGQENERLEAVVQEVYDALEEENYTLARVKATTISFVGPSGQGGYDAKNKWEQVRNDLLKIIDAESQSGNSDLEEITE